VIAALGLAASSRALVPEATHMTPPPQPPLEVIRGLDVTPLRDQFNRFADRPRVLILVSPT
jgi:hypothetical protein